jgi:hypothetical protein
VLVHAVLTRRSSACCRTRLCPDCPARSALTTLNRGSRCNDASSISSDLSRPQSCRGGGGTSGSDRSLSGEGGFAGHLSGRCGGYGFGSRDRGCLDSRQLNRPGIHQARSVARASRGRLTWVQAGWFGGTRHNVLQKAHHEPEWDCCLRYEQPLLSSIIDRSGHTCTSWLATLA